MTRHAQSLSIYNSTPPTKSEFDTAVNSIPSVVNNHTSDSTTAALAAAQGKWLFNNFFNARGVWNKDILSRTNKEFGIYTLQGESSHTNWPDSSGDFTWGILIYIPDNIIVLSHFTHHKIARYCYQNSALGWKIWS